jgi:membrane fusion protein, multidrug efflux system
MTARSIILLACVSGILASVAGCKGKSPQPGPRQKPVAPVSLPVSREVTDFVDFTGRTQAINSVNIVARATGYLVKEPFKEGSDVKKDDLLFEIDPRPYKAQYDQAEGQVNLYKAQVKLARATLARDLELQRLTPGAISPQQVDQDRAALEQADAEVKAAQANLEVYNLNLGFCKVTSPIDGQVSRYYITLGNLVTQDQTLLTTVVSLDPMYAYCDVDEPTVLRVREAINEGKIRPYNIGHIPVLMGLQGEPGYPRKGNIDFVNNQLNPSTGSILVRGVFDNPLPSGGSPGTKRRILSPGMFVRIRLPIGQPHQALLVIDSCISSDQDRKYVWVADKEGNVTRHDITTGDLQPDGLRVVLTGLKADDLVVVGALQQMNPKVQVQLEQHTMQELTGREAESGSPPANSSSKPANSSSKAVTSGGTAAEQGPGGKAPEKQ